MYSQVRLNNLADYFTQVGNRSQKGPYFCYISSYSVQVRGFLTDYAKAASKSGMLLEEPFPGPENSNIDYCREIVGDAFSLDKGFIRQAVTKWMPKMDAGQVRDFSDAMFAVLERLSISGKPVGSIKNLFIKYMCWLYYRFNKVASDLGRRDFPKILVYGRTGKHEIAFLSILASVGCDVLVVCPDGKEPDIEAGLSLMRMQAVHIGQGAAFPRQYGLRDIVDSIGASAGIQAKYKVCPNASWMGRGAIEDIRVAPGERGPEGDTVYNCFSRVTGVDDRSSYENTLYQLQADLKADGRKVVIVNAPLRPPSNDEIRKIRRKDFQTIKQMAEGLSGNIRFPEIQEMERLMKQAFVGLMVHYGDDHHMPMPRLVSKAVYVLCWLARYQYELFRGWKYPEIPCFLLMNGCSSEAESLFLTLLSRLPVDVLILAPNINRPCCLNDKNLHEERFQNSLEISRYPEEGFRMSTVAFHAERDMDESLYQGTGLFRNYQYKKANAVILQTMYEEIPILWNQELKYRPGFSIINDTVNIPTIFAKISGVKDGDTNAYWRLVRELSTEDTYLIESLPIAAGAQEGLMKQAAPGFLKDRRLLRERIKGHRSYPYGILKETTQDYLLDKLQLMLDQRLIRGIYENGTEYTVIATVLNLNTRLVQMIQSFDFTKKNPKLLFVLLNESALSLEDTVIAVFLNQVGFDVLFFVPTGYETVEKYLSNTSLVEHQVGAYRYDLTPKSSKGFQAKLCSWLRGLTGNDTMQD